MRRARARRAGDRDSACRRSRPSTPGHVEAAIDRRSTAGRATARGRGSRRRTPSPASPRRANGCSRWRATAGSVAFATTPARRRCSPLYRRLAARAACRGRRGAQRRRDRRRSVRAAAGCAGSTASPCSPTAPPCSATTASKPPSEWLFTLPRPDLVVSPTAPSPASPPAPGSRWWPSPTSTRSPSPSPPGRAGPSGSFRSTTVGRPRAYSSLLDLLETLAAAPPTPLDRSRPSPRTQPARSCSFATRAASAYAHPAEKRGKRKG